jgi:hypothetical protein
MRTIIEGKRGKIKGRERERERVVSERFGLYSCQSQRSGDRSVVVSSSVGMKL